MAVNLNNMFLKPVPGVSGQSLTVTSGSAVSLATSTAFSVSTNCVTVDVQTADVFVTFGGETPSTTVGHRLYAGQNLTWSKSAAIQAKFIAAAGNATLYASEWSL